MDKERHQARRAENIWAKVNVNDINNGNKTILKHRIMA